VEQSQGGQAMNVPIGPAAFVFKHRKTGQVVVSSVNVSDYWGNKEWEHTASINACLAIQYILSVKPKERNRYLRSLTEKI
jgi:hypothetical protein